MAVPIFTSSRTSLVFLMTMFVLSFLVTGCARKSNRTTKVTVAGEALISVEPDSAVCWFSRW